VVVIRTPSKIHDEIVPVPNGVETGQRGGDVFIRLEGGSAGQDQFHRTPKDLNAPPDQPRNQRGGHEIYDTRAKIILEEKGRSKGKRQSYDTCSKLQYFQYESINKYQRAQS
jgi:hypothetical protein